MNFVFTFTVLKLLNGSVSLFHLSLIHSSLFIHSYISKVDVLKILVSANYKYIPSLDDIRETTAVTRLRNQLLEAEYYQLAVEVRLFTQDSK